MILALHVAATYILINIFISLFKEYKIPINIHTLPVILLGTLFLAVTEYTCIKHFKVCLPFGIFFATIIFLLESSNIPTKPVPLLSRLTIFLIVAIFWSEAFVLMMFHFIYTPADEKSKS